MPRTLTLRSLCAAMTMAVAALCGGGKASAEQKGTLSFVEVRSNAALRPDQRKRAAEYLRAWLRAEGHSDAVVTRTKSGPLTVWTRDDHRDALEQGLPQRADISFHEVDEDAKQPDLEAGKVADDHKIVSDAEGSSPRLWAVRTPPLLTVDDIQIASAGFASWNDQRVVNFRLTNEGSQTFGEWSAKSVDRIFAIVVDGEVLTAPVIREPILNGLGQISGNFTTGSAELLAARIMAPPKGITFVVLKSCLSGIPRAPPSWAPKWVVPEPSCD